MAKEIMERKDEILLQEEEEFLCLSSEESEENDLSYWEFINPSDADSDDDYIDQLLLDSGLGVSWHSSVSSSAITIQQNAQFDAILGDVGVGCVEGEDVSYVGNQYDQDEDEDVDEDNHPDLNNDHDDYDDDAYDLDDELVPRSVSRKLGRQRMRKLGKRAFTKMNNSKKSPFLYVKPGAVHGKHGLGMKHSC